ncbi:uncharacterized protein LOC101239954 isoform X1 [Hydra vulgaris]|uniref:uncharacterized protein LOC101239954 isoform X1 n=1 Tax=Hydra vulgaris TaxID=6087 RepID=UPI0006412EA8|nr:uncharacterized protein LOC101239954 [Hydra vulgaris]
MAFFEAFKVDLENITKKYENVSSIGESFNVSDLSDPENEYISNNSQYVEETESDEDSIDESSSSNDSLMDSELSKNTHFDNLVVTYEDKELSEEEEEEEEDETLLDQIFDGSYESIHNARLFVQFGEAVYRVTNPHLLKNPANSYQSDTLPHANSTIISEKEI